MRKLLKVQKAKKLALAAIAASALMTANAHGYDAATDDAAFGSIADKVGGLIDGSGGYIIALIAGAMTLFGFMSSNMKLVGGGILTAIVGGTVVTVVTNLHGFII